MAASPPIRPYAFTVGRWRVDPMLDTLLLDGRSVKLEPRMMRLLVALARQPGAVCSATELLDEVWPGLVVTAQSLYQAIGELRAVLRADAMTAEFIATVPRRGYRLVAEVAMSNGPPAASLAERSPEMTAVARRSIAVLPFRTLALPAELGFLRETLLAELVLELSRQPGLVTIARGTMLSYLGESPAPLQVARELGVRYVVAGSLSTEDGQLDLACELIDASNGAAISSEALRVPLERRRELVRHVVGPLVRGLRLELLEHATRDIRPSNAAHSPALDLAMRAWVELYCRPQTRTSNDCAWMWAAEALKQDSSIAAAWNVVAYCEWRAAQYDWHTKGWTELLADAVEHAQRAVSLDAWDPDAHYTLAVASYTSGETELAEATLRHCLRISASYAPAYGLLGMVRAVLGHPEETADWCARAHELSPLEPLRAIWHWAEACALSMLGRDQDALDGATLGIAANPDYPNNHLIAAVTGWRLGHPDASARHVAALRATSLRSLAQVRKRLPPMRVEPWATAFLADLSAAGLPDT